MYILVRIGCKFVVSTTLDILSNQTPLIVKVCRAFSSKGKK
jgi:hypothetical protein